MGLFDFLNKTKEHIGREKEAEGFIDTAKECIKQGKEIYKNAYDSVKEYADQIDKKLRDHLEYKNKIISETAEKINFKMPENKNKKTIKPLYSGMDIFDSAFPCPEPYLSMEHYFDVNIFDMFINEDEYNEAKKEMEQAQEYKNRIEMKSRTILSYKERLSEIDIFINYEKKVLDSLCGKIKNIFDCVKNENEENADCELCRKAVKNIFAEISKLVSEEFLDYSFLIEYRYKKTFAGIKNINSLLPENPSPQEEGTISAVKEILKNESIVI